jgi:hypothetical protein
MLISADVFIYWNKTVNEGKRNLNSLYCINLLAAEFGIYILAHLVHKMRITQEPINVAIGNERHFEEEKT